MFEFLQRLNSKELHWLDRRAKDKYGIGVPEQVREKIIKLGYGIPEGPYSFKLTPKGIECLRKRGKSRQADASRVQF